MIRADIATACAFETDLWDTDAPDGTRSAQCPFCPVDLAGTSDTTFLTPDGTVAHHCTHYHSHDTPEDCSAPVVVFVREWPAEDPPCTVCGAAESECPNTQCMDAPPDGGSTT